MNRLRQKKIESNIIKDVRDLFSLQKEIDDTTIKDMRNICRLKKSDQAIKDRILGTFLSMKKIVKNQ